MSTAESPSLTRTFTVDPMHSDVSFVVRHMMIAKVRGHFNGVNGKIELPATGNVPVRIEATIDAATVDTREPQRDGHLKSPDFFDVEKFPQLTFRSTKIEGTDDDFRVTGELTIHGTTNEVTFEASCGGSGKDPWGNQRVAYEATAKISRGSYGLTYNQALEAGGVMVGDEIKIELDIEAVAAA